MQKMIPVDKLARPENHVLVALERIRRARQATLIFLLMLDEYAKDQSKENQSHEKH